MNEARENLVNVLVITALKDELDAFLACDDESGQSWQKLKDSLKYPYYKKSFRHSNGKLLTIAVARPVEMGEYSTSILATRLVSELKPSCLAMIGVCAGNKKDVFLGDVIVANRVFKFDFGKLIAYYESKSRQKIRTEEIFHDIRTYNLKRLWESSIQDFSKEWIDSIKTQRPKSYHHQERWLLHKLYNYREYPSQNINPLDHPERAIECRDWKKVIERLREKELLRTESFELTEKGISEVKEDKLLYLEDEHYKDCLTPALHLGVIATTSSVQKDPELFSRLEKLQRRVYGVEMEGAVIGAVAEIHEIPMIVVKSVQDYADYDKNDQFRLYAAETSARFLLDFLKRESI
jgi:nucleoside phosphorylase